MYLRKVATNQAGEYARKAGKTSQVCLEENYCEEKGKWVCQKSSKELGKYGLKKGSKQLGKNVCKDCKKELCKRVCKKVASD